MQHVYCQSSLEGEKGGWAGNITEFALIVAIRWGSISNEDSQNEKKKPQCLQMYCFCRKRIHYSNSTKLTIRFTAQGCLTTRCGRDQAEHPLSSVKAPPDTLSLWTMNHQCAWNISHPGSTELNLHRCFLHLTGPAGIFLLCHQPQQLTFLEVSLRPDAGIPGCSVG